MAALESLWSLWLGALALDPAAYQTAVSTTSGRAAAFAILLLAGISLTVGQSAVLFANRIPPRRMVHSLGLGSLLFGFVALLWTGLTWLVLALIQPAPLPLVEVFTLVCLSFAPLLFGWLILLPYLGNLLFYLLYLWALVCLLFGLQAVYAVTPLQALAAALPGFLAVVLISHSRLMDWLLSWTWRISGGRSPAGAAPYSADIQSLADEYARRIGDSR